MRIVGVDAFAREAFRGNPALVGLLDADTLPPGDEAEAWLRAVAAEANQPVTAFVRVDGPRHALRWFTTAAELSLCGHGTLAAAHVLFEAGHAPRERPVVFDTRGGEVTARHDGERVWLSLPAGRVEQAEVPAGLREALGVDEIAWFGRSDVEFVVELASAKQVSELRPDIAALGAWPVIRVVVTAWGGSADITSRVFTPSIGVPEDQVTGSAHATLAPLWARRAGRDTLTAVQASARGGALALVVRGDRVEVGGHAVTVSRGDLLV